MKSKLYQSMIWLVVLAMLLAACQPAATEVVVEATTAVEPTAVPPTAVPTPVPPTATPEPTAVPPTDWMAVFTSVVAAMPADKGYSSVSAANLNTELTEKPPFLVDVRELSEVEKDGYIKGSINLPIRELLKNLDKLPGLDEPIVVLCASGHRGGLAMGALKALGYTNVRNVGGGLNAWKKAGMPLETGAPAAAAAISTPIVADEQLFTALDEFLSGLPEGFLTVSAANLNTELAEKAPFILDVRSDKEWNETGKIDGAVHIAFENVLTSLDQLPAKDQPIVVMCASGHRGSVIMMALKFLGYENVRNLGGGLNAWKAAKLPVAGWEDWNAVWGDFLTNIPEGYYTIKAADLNASLAENAPFILDVRETAEVEKGIIAGSVSIPVREVLKNLDKLPAQDQKIVVLCQSGARGAMVMAALRLLGYTDVVNLAGGLNAWVKAELPVVVEAPAALTAGTAPVVDEDRFAALDKFLSELPDGFYTVKAVDLNIELGVDPKPFVFDVRTTAEISASGYITGALIIPINEVWGRLSELPKDKAAPIVVLCQSGHRGAMVSMALRMNGWTNVRNLAGGMNAWVAAQLPVAKP